MWSCNLFVPLDKLYRPLRTIVKTCLIYSVSYLNCENVYIGQTKRGLVSCLAESKRANRYQKSSDLPCSHMLRNFIHLIDRSDLHRENCD